jgi:uncharacterized protein YhaN
MILRQLRVEHFRHHNAQVKVDFDPRFTIVNGLNEAGKTTLFEALQYAFFRRSGAKGKDVDALAPWDTKGLPPTVTIEFEHGGAEYRLCKKWGKQGGTLLSKRNASGMFMPDKVDDADDFLAGIFSGLPPKQGAFSGFNGQHMGLAYLLFVPQGAVPIAGESKDICLNTDARAQLTQIVGAAAQDPRSAQIASKILTAYKAQFKDNGSRRATTDAARLAAAIAELETKMASIREAVADFESAAEDLAAAEAALAEATPCALAAKHAAREGRPRYQQALEANAGLRKAEGDYEQLKGSYDQLMEQSRRREAALHQIGELQPVRDRLRIAFGDAEAAHAEAVVTRAQATAALEAATAPDETLAKLETELSLLRRAVAQGQKLSALTEQANRARSYAQRISEIDAKSKESGTATEADLKVLTGYVETERELQIRLDASMTSLAVVAEQRLTLAWQAGESSGSRQIEKSEHFELSADGRIALSIDGVASLEIVGPVSNVEELRTQLAKCRRDLDRFDKTFGMRDPLEMNGKIELRRNLKIDRAGVLADLDRELSGTTLETLQQTIAALSSEITETPDAARVAQLEADVEERKSERAKLNAELTAATRSASTRERERSEDLEAARFEFEQVQNKWCAVETELSMLQRDGETEAERSKILTEAFTKRFEAEQACKAACEAYEPFKNLGDPTAALARLEEEASRLALAEQKAESQVRELKLQLAAGYAKAPSTELIELEEELARKREQLEDEELTEKALKRLRSFVTEAEARRIDSFAQPVLDRVAPWFEAVTGRQLEGLDLTGDNELHGLHFAGVNQEVRFDELSQGTCDQLALLIRLAFASLLTSPQCLGMMPVLLDDPLVHADWERRPRFGNVLEQVASGTQVVVFTCRPEDYAGLQARVVTIDSADAGREAGAA